MCVIVCKRRGLNLPSDDIIEKCFNSNDDGFGLAFVGQGDPAVTIRKGAMSLMAARTLIKSVPNPKEKDIIFHFRTATQGKVCPENCHPFPMSSKRKWLRHLNVLTPIAVAHNGVIGIKEDGSKGYGGGLTCDMTDTQYFVRFYLAHLGMSVLNTAVKRLVLDFAGGKFAILSKQGITMLGDFHEQAGLHYSNLSWQTTARAYTCRTANTKLYAPCDFCGRFGELAQTMPFIYACRFCAYSLRLEVKGFNQGYEGLPTASRKKLIGTKESLVVPED